MLFILVTVPSLRADPVHCVSAPTRACTFDLAVEVAEQYAPGDWARGMRRVAVLQESVGFEERAETLADFIAAVPQRLPDPGDIVGAFLHLSAASLRNGLPKAPRTAEAMAHLLLDQAERLEGPARDSAVRTAAGYFAFSPERDRIVEMTRSAAPYLRPRIVFAATRGLSACGQTAMLPELFELIVDRRTRDDAKGLAADLLALNDDFDNAERLIATIESSRERRNAWVSVMVSRNENQQFDEVRRIARYIEKTWLLDGFHGLRSTLELTHARLGDRTKLLTLLQGRGADSIGLDPDYLAALAAMINGDPGPVLAYQEWIEAQDVPSYRVPDNKDIVRDHLGSAQTDLTPFLAYFAKSHPNDRSARDIYDRVLFLGAKQAELGDLEGARMTFMGADFVRETHMGDEAPWPTNGYWLALERLMLERGMVKEAVASAYRLGDAVALAELAVLME